MTAKKKQSGNKKKSRTSEVSEGSPSVTSSKNIVQGTAAEDLPAADAPLIKGSPVRDESKSELKFARDRSLDALIIEEPKGTRLDEVRTSKVNKRPLIEIPEDAIVPDPKTRSVSGPDEDAAFGLSGEIVCEV